MSGEIAIRAEGLGKKYIIGHEVQAEATLRDAIVRGVAGLGRAAAAMARGRAIVRGDNVEEFWALRDINFEVRRGEVLGVIGRNGAGKSTLLKILSRITEPTEGRVTINGRVSSLLEVGTGFHPELTGRENIYLNGAILGMSRAEIRSKFDEIVDFAGVERFLDTPVKRYSSGMYVRLAFAVAAHLEPEILIVDEVLAVGDAEFQKKCLGKMQNIAGKGRTVLFVSHNLQAIERLCTRAVMLRIGELTYEGNVTEACRLYTTNILGWDPERRLDDLPRQGSGDIRFTRLEVFDQAGHPATVVPAGAPFAVRISYNARTRIQRPHFGFALLTANGLRIFNSSYTDTNDDIALVQGDGVLELRIQGLTLAVGHLLCNISAADQMGCYLDYLIELPLLEVSNSQKLPRNRPYEQGVSGIVFADVRWSLKEDTVPSASAESEFICRSES